MKKIFIFIVVLLLLVGCGTKKTVKSKSTVSKHNIIKENEYTDANVMPIGIYINDGSKLKKVTNYEKSYQEYTDIGVFQVFPSNDDEITINNSYPNDFYDKWTSIDKNNNYKIGFNLKYTVLDKEISYNILNPNDTWKDGYYEYLLVYLYDDYVNRNSSWYSHLEQKDYNDNTYFTSIKLTANEGHININSKVVLTVFTYDGMDDFDPSTNEYRGNSKYSIEICSIGKTC